MEGEKTKKCSNCDQDIPESKLFLHERFCANNIKRCKVCNKPIVIEDEEERRLVLQEIIKTLIKDNLENGMAYAEKMLEKTTCFVIDIEHMTGKGLAK